VLTAADRDRLDRATAALDPPFAVVDLAAFDANRADLVRRAAGKPIRLASKSVRCRTLMDRAALDGILAFTLPEALWLAELGYEDVVVAYPSSDRAALARAAGHPHVTVMVDCTEHLDALGPRTRVCIDVDAAWWLLGGRIRLGAKRSPIHAPEPAAALAQEIVRRGHVLDGIMSYEGHIAGLGDSRRPAIQWMQRRSSRELARRRAAVVDAVKQVAEIRFVNGGGTGSLEVTSAEAAVTEVAAGSGLFAPTLFDGYRAFTPRPAALFALSVVRLPKPGYATVLGGGYPASGPAGKSRLPSPVLPLGLRLDGQEGAGEVQTPLHGADDLKVGDRVWFRHAKAGELCERFNTLHLIDGDQVVDEVPTYRGEGMAFL
jgi:D-serine deaminase-like pyridoxal phosphate-dependent protein